MEAMQRIADEWKPRHDNKRASVEWWNSRAEQFSAKELPTAENSLGMRLILQESMVKKGDKAIDIGCGGGRFSFALEQLGADVVGTDFSASMIEEAKKKATERGSSVNFRVDDWHTIGLTGAGWEKHFDLVLAHMTPAIVSYETFMKLSEASRNWCLMVRPARRTNSVLDKLNELLGAERESHSLDMTVAYAFESLWFMGYRPKVEYQDQTWHNERELNDAVKEYTLRLKASRELDDNNISTIRGYLESISQDGKVRETTQTLIVAMYWQVS